MQPIANDAPTPRQHQQQQRPAAQCDGSCAHNLKRYAGKIRELEEKLAAITTKLTNLLQARNESTGGVPPLQTTASAAAASAQPSPRPAPNTQNDAAAISDSESDMDCAAIDDDDDDEWTDHDPFDALDGLGGAY
uniref:Uncharacterized protein n=1 Tax=Drosophila pseudoobscura pseudoobscura TaxID=46245 RepID=A0A0R3NWC4_DROPS